MKILMATMGLDIGGAETHIVELAKELKHLASRSLLNSEVYCKSPGNSGDGNSAVHMLFFKNLSHHKTSSAFLS